MLCVRQQHRYPWGSCPLSGDNQLLPSVVLFKRRQLRKRFPLNLPLPNAKDTPALRSYRTVSTAKYCNNETRRLPLISLAPRDETLSSGTSFFCGMKRATNFCFLLPLFALSLRSIGETAASSGSSSRRWSTGRRIDASGAGTHDGTQQVRTLRI